jgi:hypothetical protein
LAEGQAVHKLPGPGHSRLAAFLPYADARVLQARPYADARVLQARPYADARVMQARRRTQPQPPIALCSPVRTPAVLAVAWAAVSGSPAAGHGGLAGVVVIC